MKIHVFVVTLLLVFPCCLCFGWGDIVGKVKGTVKDLVDKSKNVQGDIQKKMKVGFKDLMEKAKGLPEKAKDIIKQFYDTECWDMDIFQLNVEECTFNVDFSGHKTLKTDCSLKKVVAGGKCRVGDVYEFARASADIEIRMESIRFIKSKVMDCDDENIKKGVDSCHVEILKDPEIILKEASGASELIYQLAKDSGLMDILIRKTTKVLTERTVCEMIDNRFFRDGGNQIVTMIQTELATKAINSALAASSQSEEDDTIKIPINLNAFGFSKNVGDLKLNNLQSQIHLRTGFFGMKGKMMEAHLDLDQITITGLATVAGYDATVSLLFNGLELSTIVDASYSPYATECHFSLNEVDMAADFQWNDKSSVKQSLLKATQYLLGVVRLDSLVKNYVQNLLEKNVCVYFENEVKLLLESRFENIFKSDEL